MCIPFAPDISLWVTFDILLCRSHILYRTCNLSSLFLLLSVHLSVLSLVPVVPRMAVSLQGPPATSSGGGWPPNWALSKWVLSAPSKHCNLCITQLCVCVCVCVCVFVICIGLCVCFIDVHYALPFNLHQMINVFSLPIFVTWLILASLSGFIVFSLVSLFLLFTKYPTPLFLHVTCTHIAVVTSFHITQDHLLNVWLCLCEICS